MTGTRSRSGRGRAAIFHASRVARTWSRLAESPVWDARGLRWLDIPSRKLHVMGGDGAEVSLSLSEMTTAIAPAAGSQMLAVTRTGFASLDPESGRLTLLATAIRDVGVRMNDACVDATGRCWAGSLSEDRSPRGALYSFDGRRINGHLDKLIMSNGIDWSPTGDRIYHVDSGRGELTAWEYSTHEGVLGKSHVLTRIPAAEGLPDGLTVDADGGIWLAVWGAGEVRCIDPVSGATRAAVQVPTPNVTSCVFGGDDYSTLFITSADEGDQGGGLIYAAEVDVGGRAANRFVPHRGA